MDEDIGKLKVQKMEKVSGVQTSLKETLGKQKVQKMVKENRGGSWEAEGSEDGEGKWSTDELKGESGKTEGSEDGKGKWKRILGRGRFRIRTPEATDTKTLSTGSIIRSAVHLCNM